MQNAITTLRIQNFKSIKDVTMQPRRVNIIIGEPNVGKSNILEAISLLGGMVYEKGNRFMGGIIRYEQPEQLFYDNILANTVSVQTEKESCLLYSGANYNKPKAVFASNSVVSYLKEKLFESWDEVKAEEVADEIVRGNANREVAEMTGGVYGWADIETYGGNKASDRRYFERSSSEVRESVQIRPYLFVKSSEVGARSYTPYLLPPNGNNLKQIIQSHAGLRQKVSGLFSSYGLKLLLRMSSNELEIAKEVGDLMYTYPYSSIADTLQRLIFYLAAIESNDDAVLLFEEPEAHSYPVYVSQLARQIVEARNNQFFVVTHSPYFITEVLEEMLTKDELKSELGIFVAYYEDYQTKVRQLSDQEVYNIRRDGVDVFYNMARFVPQQGG